MYYYSSEGPTINDLVQIENNSPNMNNVEQNSRSPVAATRANSLASANSPTESGSACLTQPDNMFNTHDPNHV